MTASDEELVAAVREIAREQLDYQGALTRETRLVETLALDSLRQLTLLVEIEDRFRISFDEDDQAAMVTLGDLLDAIRRKEAGGARTADAR